MELWAAGLMTGVMVMTNEERNMTNCSAKMPLTLKPHFSKGETSMHACVSYAHMYGNCGRI